VLIGADRCRSEQKIERAANVTAGALIEKLCRIERQAIARLMLGQKAENGQVVAQNMETAFGRAASRRQFLYRLSAFGNGGKEAEFDSALERRRALIRLSRLKKQAGRRLDIRIGHEDSPWEQSIASRQDALRFVCAHYPRS